MISAAPMMKYWKVSQKTLMGTGSLLASRPSACTFFRRTTSTTAATTIEKVLICTAQVSQQVSRATSCKNPTTISSD